MEKFFDISLVDPLSFIGVNDKNIKILEDSFSTKIVIRGSQIKLNGKKSEIEVLSNILNNMLTLVEKKGYVDERDVFDFINAKNSLDDNKSSISADKVILHTFKGTVYAKTKGQKKKI